MGQKVCETLISTEKLGMMAHTCHSSNGRKLRIGGMK
jgi:hypothetical protein